MDPFFSLRVIFGHCQETMSKANMRIAVKLRINSYKLSLCVKLQKIYKNN